MSRPQAERVLWKDHVSEDEWVSKDSVVPRSHTIESVGIVVTETPEMLVLALNFDPEGDAYSCIMHICKELILKREVLG